MRRYETFNGNWIFAEGFAEHRVHELQVGETVRLPHSAVEVPYNYFDET
ncbi:MAG: lacZ, partial [Rhizobium sp.]|nr:lacZ [Rhizobium sp.]